MNTNLTTCPSEFSESGFWAKVSRFARRLGREGIEKALLLYYVLQGADVPIWAKSTVVGALGYFIFPLDVIPDVLPVVGFSDDLAVMGAALATVAAHVTPEMHERARLAATEWL